MIERNIILKQTFEEFCKEMSKYNSDKVYLKKLYDETESMPTYPSTTNECLQLIIDVAIDYDGYDSVEGLKSLIDEMAELARKALNLNQ